MVFILVLYKCDIEYSLSYLTISKSLVCANKKGVLFIFDNSPDMHEINNIDLTVWEDIKYIYCPENKGLGFAYNLGAEYGREHEINWVVLLDQDTTFSEDFIYKLNKSIELHANLKLFAPIIRLKNNVPFSPTRYKHKRGYIVELTSGIYSLLKYSPVNSGMVVNINYFWKAGGYNPLIMLDFADFQFIERFRRIEKDFFVIDTIAIQDFSNDEKDIKKLKTRFKIYCECAKKCDRNNIMDVLGYFYSVFRHALGLIMKTKNISFFWIFVTNYLLK